MTDAKIEINVAGISFTGEGDKAWLSEQLTKILATAAELAKTSASVPIAPAAISAKAQQPSPSASPVTTTLATHIRAKKGESNQVRRFLAVADWLRLRGETMLTAAKVTKALSDNQQRRLANSPDCLNKNVRKGFCEKTGNGFFITPDGLADLGYAE